MKVYLVGAGPGDEGLITVKGLRLLKAADVVVYDYLSEFGLLRHVKPGTKLICVGKSPGRHSASQAEINAMLIDEARAAKSPGVVIVRLKGGDPFVFGRGGEEVDALREAGIDFEVVPGVSSAWAAPAYAGIPLTHREFSSSVAIVTGHQAAERKDLNLQALAQTVDTLVLLMGMANIDHICSQLLAGGLEPQTPAAVIERGSCAGQRKLVSDLGNIVQKSLEAGLSAPAVIVIGKVAQLGNFSNWFEQKPLAGRRIAVTRARHQRAIWSCRCRNWVQMCLNFLCLRLNLCRMRRRSCGRSISCRNMTGLYLLRLTVQSNFFPFCMRQAKTRARWVG